MFLSKLGSSLLIVKLSPSKPENRLTFFFLCSWSCYLMYFFFRFLSGKKRKRQEICWYCLELYFVICPPTNNSILGGFSFFLLLTSFKLNSCSLDFFFFVVIIVNWKLMDMHIWIEVTSPFNQFETAKTKV